MAHASIYDALPSPTSIRVLLLAPGKPDDEIFCWMVPSDLDADHDRFPDSPRPTESITIADGKTATGESRRFMLPLDIYFSKHENGAPMHEFQRYSALSYVWGDLNDPKHITLDGESFPVTKNLHAALRCLRRPNEGIRLWVDALCINQADFEEKKIQIGLMRRVYEQAESVVAYIPLPDEDQQNIVELVPEIIKARGLVLKALAALGTKNPGLDGPEKALSSALAYQNPSPTVWLNTDKGDDLEAITMRRALDQQGGGNTLETFGLPAVDSPLWVSWRRFFASPYFERIWILQEFSLAKNLRFDLGAKSIDAGVIMLACDAIKSYSGAKNSEYMQRHAGHDESPQSVNGPQRAWTMIQERAQVKAKFQTGLVDKLLQGRRFLATDPRDKVYALLSLAKDGQLFNEHVSYGPDETPVKVFARFASLLVENGHGEAVFLQAGMGGSLSRDGLPSWVPNWTDPFPRTNPPISTSQPAPKTTATSPMRVTDHSKLTARGAILDRIQHITEEFPRSPNEEFKFIRIFVKSAMLINRIMSANKKPEDSAEDAADMLFSVIVRKEFHSEEALPALKSGFRSFLGWFPAVVKTSSQLTEGRVAIVPLDSPDDFRLFMDAAFRSTRCTRFCVTEQGYFGLVPLCADVNDEIALFDGGQVPFVLRGSGGADGSYLLVGNGYFHGFMDKQRERSTAAESRDISLV